MLDVDDRYSLPSSRDVRVGASHIQISCVLQRHSRPCHKFGLVEARDVEHFQPFTIDNETIAKLDGNPVSIDQQRGTDLSGDLGLKRIIDTDHYQSTIAEHVGISPG